MYGNSRHLGNTSKSGDPKGIAQLTKLREFQLKWLHRLQRQWNVLLQMAKEFDESVTFRRLSGIIESPEDTMDEAWLYAKERVDPYVENETHRTPSILDASTPLQPAAASLQSEHKANKDEHPKLTVLQHASDTNVSRVNTTAVCATVAHTTRNKLLTTPEPSIQTTDDETANLPRLPPLDHGRGGGICNGTLMTLEPLRQTDDETESLPTLPSLDHDREEDTSTAGSVTNPKPVTSCYLNELAATLEGQMQRIEDKETGGKDIITNKVILVELETLITATR